MPVSDRSSKRPSRTRFRLSRSFSLTISLGRGSWTTTRVMDNLVGDTQKKVDVLVITHEHWDHLSGFTQAPDSFAKLGVGAVWVAWTEDPKDDLANQLRTELGAARQKLVACANALRRVQAARQPLLTS